MQIEKIQTYPDGNWVAYGKYDPATKKSPELARGKGDCPLSVGDSVNSHAPKRAKNKDLPQQIFNARQSALKNAVALWNDIKVCQPDAVIMHAEKFEKWILRKE